MHNAAIYQSTSPDHFLIKYSFHEEATDKAKGISISFAELMDDASPPSCWIWPLSCLPLLMLLLLEVAAFALESVLATPGFAIVASLEVRLEIWRLSTLLSPKQHRFMPV